ncbi:hypothetical protein [Delftia lacustris]|uniref:hypothetical protein n=1 Tax=Delftia lacustris TaxID=558537 RepID=UPI001EEFEAC4|nr:hypothetical protein [Delftia lacustris]
MVIDLRAHRGDDAYQLLPHMLASLYTRDKPLRMQDAAQRLFDPAARVWRSRGGLGLPAQLPLAATGAPFTAPVAVLTGPAAPAPANCSPPGCSTANVPTSSPPAPRPAPPAPPHACTCQLASSCKSPCSQKPAPLPATTPPHKPKA